MIRSMTGFASVQRQCPGGRLSIDIRSVNHRYLEQTLRLPDELRAAEPAMREAVAARLGRGKVDLRATWQPEAGAATGLRPDRGTLSSLQVWQRDVLAMMPDAPPLRVADVLRWPGVLDGVQPDVETLRDEVLAALAGALDELDATRMREGARLAALMLERVAAMRTEVAAVEPLIPGLVANYRERLAARLREAAIEADPARLAQEFALFANRIDIDEEVGRLRTHLDELERLLNQGGTVGKRLDFLLQELQREANTLGSKSVAVETSRTSMALKVLIEQVREQAQNVE
ncbi:MAG: YicC family protein [Burkholderiales bacterium]|nr:YicC family protein [Burkholderiales bacterium]